MKKLVLGAALVVAAASVGCGSSGGGENVLVDVNWSFTEVATNTAVGCPDGFGTAVIVSQSIDPVTHLGTGAEFTDKFNCSDLQGTIELPDDTYLIWVEIKNDSETDLYAQSDETVYDTLLDSSAIDAVITYDGGYFFLEWDLYDSTNRLVTCEAAGIGSSGSVDVVSTGLTSGTISVDDSFDCRDYYGVTAPVLPGSYQVSIEAVNASKQAIGDAPSVTKDIAVHGYTNLGLVKIQLDQ